MKYNKQIAVRDAMRAADGRSKNQWTHLFLAGLLVAIMPFFAGCTVMDSCDDFDDHEYCVGNDCVCGVPCSWQSCHNQGVCVRYEYEPTHGVCVPDEFQEEYDLPLIGESSSNGNGPLECGSDELLVDYQGVEQCMATCDGDFDCESTEWCHDAGVCIPD